MDAQGRPSIRRTVRDVTAGMVESKKNELINQEIVGSTAADSIKEVIEYYSKEKLKVDLDMTLDAGLVDATGSLNIDDKETETTILVKYFQHYFSIEVEDPSTLGPEGFFKEVPGNLADDAVYVSSVDYGRLLLFSFSSFERRSTIKAAVDAAVDATVDGSLGIDIHHDRVLKRSKTKVRVLGGAATAEAELHNGYEEVKQWIDRGLEFSRNSPGKPIAYRFKFVSDSSRAFTNVITDPYQKRECYRKTMKYRVVVHSMRLEYTNENDGRIELRGRIYVYGYSNGRIIFVRRVWRPAGDYQSIVWGREIEIEVSVDITFEDYRNTHENSFIRVTTNFTEVDDDIILPLVPFALDQSNYFGEYVKDVRLDDIDPTEEYVNNSYESSDEAHVAVRFSITTIYD